MAVKSKPGIAVARGSFKGGVPLTKLQSRSEGAKQGPKAAGGGGDKRKGL